MSASKLSAIMFSDIVGYSRLMGEDRDRTLAILDEQNALIVAAISRREGTVIKFIGDAVMACFDSAHEAVHCAVEIQRAVAERNAGQPAENRFQLRIGIALDDAAFKNGDVFGNGVNVAARLQPLAEPGGVCVSEMAYGLLKTQSALRFESIGIHHLKNIVEPNEVYRVLGTGSSRGWRLRLEGLARRVPRPAAVALAAALLAYAGWRYARPAVGKKDYTAFMIAVAPFNPSSPSAAEQAKAARTIIERRLEQELDGEHGVTVDGTLISEAPRTLAQAREAGLKARADVVIWGDAIAFGSDIRIQPYVTIARPSADSSALNRTNLDGAPISMLHDQAKGVDNLALAVAAHFFSDRSPAKALSLLRRIDPPTVDEKISEARALIMMGRWEESEVAAKAAVKMAPKLADPHRALAILCLSTGNADCAIAEIRTALKLEPNSFDSYRTLGIAYRKKHDLARALESLQKSVDLKPDGGLSYIELAALDQAMGRWNDSLAQWAIAVDRRPNDVYAKMLYALSLARVGRVGDAKAYLEKHYAHAAEMSSKLEWPYPAMSALLGRISEQELLAEARTSEESGVAQSQAIEARYYYGMGQLLGLVPTAPRDAALANLRAVATTELKAVFFEKDLAADELRLIEKPVEARLSMVKTSR